MPGSNTRSMNYLKDKGFEPILVEKTIPRTFLKVDFCASDVYYPDIKRKKLVLVQAFYAHTDPGGKMHRLKIKENRDSVGWKSCGGEIWLHEWRKPLKASGGKWRLKRSRA